MFTITCPRLDSAEHVVGVWRIGIVEVRQQNTPKKRVLIALLIIDLAYILLLVVKVPLAISDLPARIIRLWKAGGEVLRHGTEQRWINAVVHKEKL